MRAAQLELGFGMVKARDVFPFRERVASCAIRAKLAMVLILVARRAGWAQAEIAAAQIPHANTLLGVWRHVLRGVAFPALHARMPALQRVACLAVIEVVHIHIPQNRDEVPAVVFRVALDAGIVTVLARHQDRMVAPFLFQALSDFTMASRTAELSRTCPANMTTRTVRRTVEIVMSV